MPDRLHVAKNGGICPSWLHFCRPGSIPPQRSQFCGVYACHDAVGGYAYHSIRSSSAPINRDRIGRADGLVHAETSCVSLEGSNLRILNLLLLTNRLKSFYNWELYSRENRTLTRRVYFEYINQSINYFICRHNCITIGTCNTEIHRICFKQPCSKYRNSMNMRITHTHTIDVSSASGF